MAAGEEPVGAAARARKARVVFTARDAAPGSVRRAEGFARLGGCACRAVPCSKLELGAAIGRGTCAMLAVTDAGLAQALERKLDGTEQ